MISKHVIPFGNVLCESPCLVRRGKARVSNFVESVQLSVKPETSSSKARQNVPFRIRYFH